MKRQLLVIRHAATERHNAGGDHARELTARGRADALRVAARIEQLGWTPSCVLCSDAARARQTWSCMQQVLDGVDDATHSEDLYLADLDRLLEGLYAADEACTRLAVIAHNPGLRELIEWLTGTPVRMTPCSAALLDGSGASWAEALGRHAWHLEEFVDPHTLAGA